MASVVNQFSKCIVVESERDQADPWLVAIGVGTTEQNTYIEYIVVAQESQAKSTKLPVAYRAFRIQSMSLAELFEKNGMTFGVSFS